MENKRDPAQFQLWEQHNATLFNTHWVTGLKLGPTGRGDKQILDQIRQIDEKVKDRYKVKVV